MVRLPDLFASLFVISVKRELAFRANLLMNIMHTVVSVAASQFMIVVVFESTGEIAGWTRNDMTVLLGVYLIIDGMLATFVEPNVLWFAGQVQSGKLDEMLLRPVSALFQLSLTNHAPLRLVQVAIGIGFVTVARSSIGDVVLGTYLLVLGLIIAWIMRVGISLLALWFPALMLDVVFEATWRFGRFPVSMFDRSLQFFLTWVIPLGLIATWPTLALTGGIKAWQVAAASVATVILSIGMRMMGRRGIRRYVGATS